MIFICLLLLTSVFSKPFNNRNQEFSIRENEFAKTVVGSINTSSYNGNLKFMPLMRQRVDQYLEVDSTSGQIRLKQLIDRETLCSNSVKECNLKFKVQIQSKDDQSINIIVDIVVNIIDTNDNDPKFTEQEYQLKISESSKIGSVLHLPKAVDFDSPENGVKRYLIINGDQSGDYFERVFQLELENKSGIVEPMLKQIGVVDRERKDKYKLNLKAEDTGGRSDVTLIIINIEDANDNYPQWVGLPYKVHVRECESLSHKLFQLTATDLDQASYGMITYRISPLVDGFIKTQFHLYGDKLYLSSSLDYENPQHRRISVPVQAIDEGGLSNETNIDIVVEDCNDNSPVINVIYTRSNDNQMSINPYNDKLVIDENNNDEVTVIPIEVYDADSGENGRVFCNLKTFKEQFQLADSQSDNEKGLFFHLTKRKGYSFDREKISTVKVEILCKDNGQSPQQSVQSIMISIRDVNDNSPQLTSSTEYFIKENNENGASVGKLEGTDLDENQNKMIDFQMVDQSEKNIFHLTKEGILYADQVLDRERTEKYYLNVVLTDRGVPPRSSLYNITVTVTDENDGIPVYLGEHSFRVYESSGDSIGQLVLAQLNASDSDQGLNGEVEFLLDQDKIYPEFARHMYSVTKSGLLTVRGILDREKAHVHQLLVIVQDRGIKPQSASVQLTVHLLDINDNRPTFTFPKENDNSQNVTVDIPVGSHITMLRAEDRDAGENGTVQFAAEPESTYFTVEKTGEVLLKMPLGQSGSPFIPQHTIYIKAYDLGKKPLSQHTQLKIYVSDRSIKKEEVPRDKPYLTNPYNGGKPDEDINHYDNNRRRQLNMLILFIMAGLVIAVFFAVIAVLVFIYFRRDRFSLFGSANPYRSNEKAGTNYNPKIKQQCAMDTTSSFQNFPNNCNESGSPKKSVSPNHYMFESLQHQNSNLYNTIFVPQTRIGLSKGNLENFRRGNVPSDNAEINQKMALLNYSNLFEGDTEREQNKEGYFSLHHAASYSRLNSDNDNCVQSGPLLFLNKELKGVESHVEFATPQQQKRCIKVDSSFV